VRKLYHYFVISLACNLYLVLHPDLFLTLAHWENLERITVSISTLKELTSILLVNCLPTEMELHLEYSGLLQVE
jgi:hypothetical protein